MMGLRVCNNAAAWVIEMIASHNGEIWGAETAGHLLMRAAECEARGAPVSPCRRCEGRGDKGRGRSHFLLPSHFMPMEQVYDGLALLAIMSTVPKASDIHT